MQITFDTTTITDDEVRGIFALLDTVRPEALASSDVDLSALAEPIQNYNEWVGEKITKLAEVATHDSTGLVWDERIHASSKALNADGTWRTKRGVDKALVAEVEAELRGAASVTLSNPDDVFAIEGEVNVSAAEVVLTVPPVPEAPVPVPTPPPAPPAPEAPPAPLAPAVTENAPVETAPQTPSAPVAPSSAVSPFVALMKRVTTAQGAGKLTQPRVKELLESLKKKSIMDLRTDDDALASFAVLLDGEGV